MPQTVEHVYPAPDAVAKADLHALSFLAFPDGNAACMGDSMYAIRLPPLPAGMYAGKPRAAPIYGFVCFRQRPDPSERRGFYQKASA